MAAPAPKKACHLRLCAWSGLEEFGPGGNQPVAFVLGDGEIVQAFYDAFDKTSEENTDTFSDRVVTKLKTDGIIDLQSSKLTYWTNNNKMTAKLSKISLMQVGKTIMGLKGTEITFKETAPVSAAQNDTAVPENGDTAPVSAAQNDTAVPENGDTAPVSTAQNDTVVPENGDTVPSPESTSPKSSFGSNVLQNYFGTSTPLTTTPGSSDTADKLAAVAKKLRETKQYDAKFKVWFKPCSIIEKTDSALRGKLVSEMAARNILDTAVLSSMDISDAVYRVINYAKQRGVESKAGTGDAQQSVADQLGTLAKTIIGERTFAEFDVGAQEVIRAGALGKKFTPMKSILNTKAQADAAADRNPATEIDASTAPFEIDDGRADTDPGILHGHLTNFIVGLWAAIAGTSKKSRNLTDVTESEFGESTQLSRQVSFGTLLYTGRTKKFLLQSAPSTEDRQEAVDEIEAILRGGTLPLYTEEIGERAVNRVFAQKTVTDILKKVNDDDFMRLFRVERAREAELLYTPIAVDYGTSADSTHFGIGTNVSMLVDCAFAAARVITKMFEDGLLDRKAGGTSGGSGTDTKNRDYFTTEYVVKSGLEKETLIIFLAKSLENLTGYCTIRTADRGRIIAGSVVNTTLQRVIKAEAESHKFKSIRATGNDRVAKFYHAIWSRELGTHAVAQGTARLEESHMMVPFLARAVASDSPHVVPTLMAVDDWIGPTEEYFRLQEMALMQIEDYASSRPTVYYTAGGRAESFSDLGSFIRARTATEDALTLEILLKAVDGSHADRAVHVLAMLLMAIQENNSFTTADPRRGGLARIKTSEATVRQLAERVARLPVKRDL